MESEKIFLTVDYSQTLAAMIAAGKYKWKNVNIIDKNFPLPAGLSGKKIAIVGKLFNFCEISSKGAICEMNEAGYRPAILPEFLALGAKHPELQRQSPLACLGSSWHDPKGIRGVPCLDVIFDERGLGLNAFQGIWRKKYKFFGVLKSALDFWLLASA